MAQRGGDLPRRTHTSSPGRLGAEGLGEPGIATPLGRGQGKNAVGKQVLQRGHSWDPLKEGPWQKDFSGQSSHSGHSQDHSVWALGTAPPTEAGSPLPWCCFHLASPWRFRKPGQAWLANASPFLVTYRVCEFLLNSPKLAALPSPQGTACIAPMIWQQDHHHVYYLFTHWKENTGSILNVFICQRNNPDKAGLQVLWIPLAHVAWASGHH